MAVEISGRLNALLGEQAYPDKVRGVWGKVVAEERYRLSPQHPFCDIAFDRALKVSLLQSRSRRLRRNSPEPKAAHIKLQKIRRALAPKPSLSPC